MKNQRSTKFQLLLQLIINRTMLRHSRLLSIIQQLLLNLILSLKWITVGKEEVDPQERTERATILTWIVIRLLNTTSSNILSSTKKKSSLLMMQFPTSVSLIIKAATDPKMAEDRLVRIPAKLQKLHLTLLPRLQYLWAAEQGSRLLLQLLTMMIRF